MPGSPLAVVGNDAIAAELGQVHSPAQLCDSADEAADSGGGNALRATSRNVGASSETQARETGTICGPAPSFPLRTSTCSNPLFEGSRPHTPLASPAEPPHHQLRAGASTTSQLPQQVQRGQQTCSIDNPVFAGRISRDAVPAAANELAAPTLRLQASTHEGTRGLAPAGTNQLVHQLPSLLLESPPSQQPDAMSNSERTHTAALSSLERVLSLASSGAAALYRKSVGVVGSAVAFRRVANTDAVPARRSSDAGEGAPGGETLLSAALHGSNRDESTLTTKDGASIVAHAVAAFVAAGRKSGPDVVPAVGGGERAFSRHISFAVPVSKPGQVLSLAPPGVERTTEEHLLDAQMQYSNAGAKPSAAQRMWASMRALVHGDQVSDVSSSEPQRQFPRKIGAGILVRARSSEASSASSARIEASDQEDRCAQWLRLGLL